MHYCCYCFECSADLCSLIQTEEDNNAEVNTKMVVLYDIPTIYLPNSNQLGARLEAHNKYPPTDDTKIETVLQVDHCEGVEGEPQATAANPSYIASGHEGAWKLVPAKKKSSSVPYEKFAPSPIYECPN